MPAGIISEYLAGMHRNLQFGRNAGKKPAALRQGRVSFRTRLFLPTAFHGATRADELGASLLAFAAQL
jgi:hypothetical protein